MMRMKFFAAVMVCALGAVSSAVFAQSVPAATPQAAPVTPQATAAPVAAQEKKVVSLNPAEIAASRALVSPEVHADRTVTFRFRGPNAKSVTVAIEGVADKIPMVAGENGIWTLTTAAMEPENYGYHFMVDGVQILDPANPVVRLNLQDPSSIVSVPGTPPKLWERADVPHGELHDHLYRSEMAQDDREIVVYTPPGYDEKRREKYPVLYLLHGYSDSAVGWTQAGQANLIFDNLLAQDKMKPMVVVMPQAYGTMEMIRKGWSVWTGEMATPRKNQELFAEQMIGEVLPMMEARYNIARDAGHRAIAGLSMGGGESLYTGINHPDVFGYVGAMSSAIVSRDYDKDYAGRSKAALALLWISCGTEDGLITSNRKFGAWAKTNVTGDVVLGETPGMHTWLVWRENLIKLTPILFTK